MTMLKSPMLHNYIVTVQLVLCYIYLDRYNLIVDGPVTQPWGCLFIGGEDCGLHPYTTSSFLTFGVLPTAGFHESLKKTTASYGGKT